MQKHTKNIFYKKKTQQRRTTHADKHQKHQN